MPDWQLDHLRATSRVCWCRARDRACQQMFGWFMVYSRELDDALDDYGYAVRETSPARAPLRSSAQV
jgi:hypothetical protein